MTLKWEREAILDNTYAHASGRISLLEKQFITSDEWQILLNPGVASEERHRVLDRANYPEAFDLEQRVLKDRTRNNKELMELDQKAILSRALLLDVDYHNIKLMLKRYLMNIDVDEGLEIHAGFIPVDDLRKLVLSVLEEEQIASDDDQASNPLLRKAIFSIKQRWQAHPALQTIDIEADRLYFWHTKTICNNRDTGSARGFLTDYFSLKSDIANLQIFLRVRRFALDKSYLARVLVEGGDVTHEVYLDLLDEDIDRVVELWQEEATLARTLGIHIKAYEEQQLVWAMGEAADLLLWRLAKQGKRTSFGADRVAAYWLERRLEQQELRLCISGLERGYGQEEIEALLRIKRGK